MKNIRGFASDNNAAVHPEILQAMISCNTVHAIGYGDDDFTRNAEAKIREHIGL